MVRVQNLLGILLEDMVIGLSIGDFRRYFGGVGLLLKGPFRGGFWGRSAC